MFYVKRDHEQKIIAIYQQAQADATECLAQDHPDILYFLAGSREQQFAYFLDSDLQLIRVLEDLIEVLLDKSVITITDFDPKVIEKLVKRRGIRSQVQKITLFTDYEDDEESPMF